MAPITPDLVPQWQSSWRETATGDDCEDVGYDAQLQILQSPGTSFSWLSPSSCYSEDETVVIHNGRSKRRSADLEVANEETSKTVTYDIFDDDDFEFFDDNEDLNAPVPHAWRCPLTLDWLENPVRWHGRLYSEAALLEYVTFETSRIENNVSASLSSLRLSAAGTPLPREKTVRDPYTREEVSVDDACYSREYSMDARVEEAKEDFYRQLAAERRQRRRQERAQRENSVNASAGMPVSVAESNSRELVIRVGRPGGVREQHVSAEPVEVAVANERFVVKRGGIAWTIPAEDEEDEVSEEADSGQHEGDDSDDTAEDRTAEENAELDDTEEPSLADQRLRDAEERVAAAFDAIAAFIVAQDRQEEHADDDDLFQDSKLLLLQDDNGVDNGNTFNIISRSRESSPIARNDLSHRDFNGLDEDPLQSSGQQINIVTERSRSAQLLPVPDFLPVQSASTRRPQSSRSLLGVPF